MDISLWVFLLIFIVITLLLWIFGYLKADPLGTGTIILANQKARNNWRKSRLNDPENKKINKLYLLVGEFGEGSTQIVEEALKLGYEVKALSGGNVFKQSKDDIQKFIISPNFSYFVNTNVRPNKHFMIIGKDLFLEVPHEFDAPRKEALGIENPDNELLEEFRSNMDNAITAAGVQKVDDYYLNNKLKYTEAKKHSFVEKLGLISLLI